MKKSIAFIAVLLALIGCNNRAVEKPANLITEDKMVDILTDVALIEAIKAENPASLRERNIIPNQYIYKKYKIDTAQFARSNKFYASDVNKYNKIYEKVTERINQKAAETDSLIAKGINLGTTSPKPKIERKERLKALDIDKIGETFRK